MSGVLFLPDVHYDYRIWADLPARLGEEHRIVHFDQGEPLPWAAPEEFLPALGALIRDDKPALVVAAGSAAGFRGARRDRRRCLRAAAVRAGTGPLPARGHDR